MGMHLSFRVSQASPLQALCIILIVSGGLGGAFVFLTWYTMGGGSQINQQNRIQSILESDPIESATQAHADRSRTFYALKSPGNQSTIPGAFPPIASTKARLREQGASFIVIEAEYRSQAPEDTYIQLLNHFSDYNTHLAKLTWPEL